MNVELSKNFKFTNFFKRFDAFTLLQICVEIGVPSRWNFAIYYLRNKCLKVFKLVFFSFRGIHHCIQFLLITQLVLLSSKTSVIEAVLSIFSNVLKIFYIKGKQYYYFGFDFVDFRVTLWRLIVYSPCIYILLYFNNKIKRLK